MIPAGCDCCRLITSANATLRAHICSLQRRSFLLCFGLSLANDVLHCVRRPLDDDVYPCILSLHRPYNLTDMT